MNFNMIIFRYLSNKASKLKLINKLKASAHQRHIDEKAMFGGVVEYKARKKQRRRIEEKEGQNIPDTAPDSEAYWLQNLSSKSIKIYRKTLSGRYKEIDKEKLAETIKSENELGKEILSHVMPIKANKALLPQIVVKNLTSVPMLSINDTPKIAVTDEEKRNYPSVTRVLSDTMSDEARNALEKWKQKMIAEMGEDGFQIFNKEQLSFGARFHLSVKQNLIKSEFKLDEDLKNVWNSVQDVLQNLSDVKLVETNLMHPKLKYKGIVDCVASYKNVPSVIEWKVSQKAKPQLAFTYDAPLQLSAYLGALSYDPDHSINLKNGVVVVAYKDGSPAQVFTLDEQLCRKYWTVWLKRLQLYWQSQS